MRKILFLLLLSFCTTVHAQYRFSAQNAFKYIEIQSEFGPRDPGSEGHKKCKEFLVEELKKFTPRVKEQNFQYEDKERKVTLDLTNIIASFGEQEQRILLCAHWDTRPFADRNDPPSKQPIIGANDGGSGVALLLEIGKHISENPLKNYGVDIVFFDAEDWGHEGETEKYCIGSKYFAENMEGISPVYGILVDLIADKNPVYKMDGYSLYYAADYVYKVWKKAQSLGYTEFVDENLGYIIDDHVALLQKGYPVIDIIDLDFPQWHTLQDTPENCSTQGLIAVGETILALIYE
ncbi:MAG: hypothetical protein DWQ06_12140 [Calditrichaeota bacterium]|nr:MAG: hypothetical protein DWQ06_12140 [Calditrichota bacterium]